MKLLALLAALVVAGPAGAELTPLKSFAVNGDKLELVMFKNPAGKTAGILGIASAKRNSYGLKAADAVTLENLLKPVAKTDSVQWRFVGSMTEVDTKSPSHLVIYAGPAVKFIVIDPSIGTNAVDLPWDDLSSFKEGVTDMKNRLKAP